MSNGQSPIFDPILETVRKAEAKEEEKYDATHDWAERDF